MKLLQNDPKEGIGSMGGRIECNLGYVFKFSLIRQNDAKDIPP